MGSVQRLKKICVVDDQRSKRDNVVRSLRKLFPWVEIWEFECVSEFLDFVRENQGQVSDTPEEWLMVLDMRMPLRSGGDLNSAAGYNALSEMSNMGTTCAAIVVSSDLIDTGRAREAYEHFKGLVIYDECALKYHPFSRDLLRLKFIKSCYAGEG